MNACRADKGGDETGMPIVVNPGRGLFIFIKPGGWQLFGNHKQCPARSIPIGN